MKKFLTVVLSVLIFLSGLVPSFAIADNSKLTYLYLDKGNIVIGDGTVSGYGYFGELVTTYDSDGYYITQTTSDTVTNTVTFDGGTNYVVFNSLNVNVQDYSKFICAVCLKNSSNITVKTEGKNTFISGSSRAGIEVPTGSTLTFIGDGQILAGSAGQSGIGGGNGNSSGTIIINSGTFIAQSKSNSAGIGGGSAGSNGKVVINGGNIIAIGGPSGAGIGGGCTGDGGEIIINGGTVTATGGSNAAGIGGGWYGSMGNIVIDGGSVKATGGSSAPAMGAGASVESDAILNSLGQELFLAKVNSSNVTDLKDILTDGKANNLSSYHSGDKNFYFYLPASTHIFAFDSDENITQFQMATYSSGFTCTEIAPFECINSSSVQGDDIIRGIACGLNNLNDYFSFTDGFSFSCSDSTIGTGTKVELMYNGKAVFSYTALIYGDLNGDGYYDGEDSFVASLMLWGHLTNENTESFYFEAADVDRSGNIDITDVETLQQAGLLLDTVPQNNDGSLNTDSVQWEEYTLIIEQSTEDSQESDCYIIEFINLIIKLIMSLLETYVLV